MCDWGTETIVSVTIPAHLSHTGVERKAEKGIDACIADIVKALNDGGVTTSSSCCGHGRQDGSIWLADGRKLVVPNNTKGENKMVDEDKNLGDAVVDLETEQGQISDEIERDTARGLWNKPDPNDTENEDE